MTNDESSRSPPKVNKVNTDRFYTQMVEREWLDIAANYAGCSELGFEEFFNLLI